jgi:hypothetical protein
MRGREGGRRERERDREGERDGGREGGRKREGGGGGSGGWRQRERERESQNLQTPEKNISHQTQKIQQNKTNHANLTCTLENVFTR